MKNHWQRKRFEEKKTINECKKERGKEKKEKRKNIH